MDKDQIAALTNFASTIANNQMRAATSSSDTTQKFHKEPWAPGKKLDNYVTREPDDEGKYVFITEHKERIELIEQPLTPEQKAEKKEQQKVALKFAGYVTAGLVSLAVLAGVYDARARRKYEIDAG